MIVYSMQICQTAQALHVTYKALLLQDKWTEQHGLNFITQGVSPRRDVDYIRKSCVGDSYWKDFVYKRWPNTYGGKASSIRRK